MVHFVVSLVGSDSNQLLLMLLSKLRMFKNGSYECLPTEVHPWQQWLMRLQLSREREEGVFHQIKQVVRY